MSDDREEDAIGIFETDWYRKVKAKTTSGDSMRIYRENCGLTQAELGALVGGIPRQHVSNMERGTRPISNKTARQLAEVLEVSPAKFI